MSVTDPKQLVAEFKKSGEFDRLRRELLSQFKNHDSIDTFMSRVEDIIQQRLNEDERLQYLPPEAAHSELMQDMDRFPLVQRAVADLPALTDPSFNASIRRSLARLLNDGPGAVDHKRSGEKAANDGDVEMDDSENSESESSDEEHEHDRDQEQAYMSQNDRIRAMTDDPKHRALVNGTDDRGTDGSPPTSSVNHSRVRGDS